MTDNDPNMFVINRLGPLVEAMEEAMKAVLSDPENASLFKEAKFRWERVRKFRDENFDLISQFGRPILPSCPAEIVIVVSKARQVYLDVEESESTYRAMSMMEDIEQKVANHLGEHGAAATLPFESTLLLFDLKMALKEQYDSPTAANQLRVNRCLVTLQNNLQDELGIDLSMPPRNERRSR